MCKLYSFLLFFVCKVSPKNYFEMKYLKFFSYFIFSINIFTDVNLLLFELGALLMCRWYKNMYLIFAKILEYLKLN